MSDISIDQKPPKKHRKRSKHANQKLPTPPPDPREPNEQKDGGDNEVFEYLETILSDYAKGTSLFTPVIATEEAFDHLEKLYKLMEQMLELKEQNVKLNRKIRELEYLNNLEKNQKDFEVSGIEKIHCPEVDRDAAFAETILESILADSGRKDFKSKLPSPTRLRSSILRRPITRASSTTADKPVLYDSNVISHRQDGSRLDKSAKVSKWTKVKAAFKWEKASSVSDNKPLCRSIHVPVNIEIAKYLRVPSTSDEPGPSPTDSGAAGVSTPGSLSTASSNEDFYRTEFRQGNEDLRSLEDESLQNSYIPQFKEDYNSSKLHFSKLSRTPWAKMKEIIHTRNSFKKKHRLSAASDDIQIDVELCTDSEDNIFDEERSTKTACISSNASPTCSPQFNNNDIPKEIINKYQKAIEEVGDKRKSRWAIVKKAFLSGDAPLSSQLTYKDNCDAEEEIQENYRKLQKKLSLEFQEKLLEWERLKQSSPSASNATTSFTFGEETKDPNFVRKMEEWEKIKHNQTPRSPMPSEFDLPPDFKKKLQEWEKIKKSNGNPKKKLGEVPKWKSLSGQRSDATLEYPPLSDDFIRKLKEWKQIKANRALETKKTGEKTPSPNLLRKNSSPRHGKKYKEQDKDLHWVDKEISKLEKEKQNLEREMQKFIEKEERLTKLKKSTIGGDKKEVLIHTPSGFHRFEGISRKFTRKLYEWEKAQGIAPEASTFALLTSSMKPALRPIIKRHSSCNISTLVRSKSADSIAVSALNLACPLLSHQPSSLSLNDVNQLENDCLLDSKDSSMQYLLDFQDEIEIDEPEAVLVEVEDYEEETAAPLHFVIEKQQLPVYQRQEFKTLCAGETIAAPKIRRSESTRAQTNYNLIEEVMNMLRHLAENEIEIKNLSQTMMKSQSVNEKKLKLKEFFVNQRKLSSRTLDQLIRLQEANSFIISSVSREEAYSRTPLSDNLEGVQDISNEVIQMAEKMEQSIKSRTSENFSSTHTNYLSLFENIRDMRTKILELRRHLSYVCAATDTTVPNKKIKVKTQVQKTISNESKSSRCDTSDNNSAAGSQKENKHYVKSENCASGSNQGAVRKRIKFRQKNMLNRTQTADSDEDDDANTSKNIRQYRKIARTRTISDGGVDYKPFEESGEGSNISRIIVSTEKNYMNSSANEEMLDTPLTVFVKTTRKLFTPIGESSFHVNSEITDKKLEPDNCDTAITCTFNEKKEESISLPDTQLQGSALPPSPIPQRKVIKDISPSIKLMLTKYNQKLSEQDSKSAKSGNSSGSSSPLWRTPTSERRVKAQTEKYQEELNKLSPLLGGREVQKSASVSYIHSCSTQVKVPIREESIEQYHSNVSSPPPTEQPILNHNKKCLSLDISDGDSSSKRLSPEIRQKKLQQAKEEFLLSTPVSAPIEFSESTLTFPTRNRLSQISMESGSSYDNPLPGGLIKSVSSGMINIDAEVYRQIHPDIPNRGYVSLPRNVNPKSSKFGFSSIASRFRKVKMRKGKDKDKMNTVSTLCRQSLVVDITNNTADTSSVIDGSNK